jgi:hypothetical protein
VAPHIEAIFDHHHVTDADRRAAAPELDKDDRSRALLRTR